MEYIKQDIKNNFSYYDKKEKKYIIKENFSICTWNIWGLPHGSHLSLIEKRIKFIIKQIRRNNNDIVCLQEVSQFVIDNLLQNKFIKNNYYISSISRPWLGGKVVFKNSKYDGPEPSCWNIILSRFIIIKNNHLVLKGVQCDLNALIIDIGFLTIVNLHLQSGGMGSGKGKDEGKENHECRIKEMRDIKQYVKENYDKNNVIYVGDFNLDLGDNTIFYEKDDIVKNLNDSWIITNKENKGYTENTDINTMRYNLKKNEKKFRYDGILYKSNKIKPIKSELFGMEPIFQISSSKFEKMIGIKPSIVIKNNKVDWFMSDHFGVITVFKFI